MKKMKKFKSLMLAVGMMASLTPGLANATTISNGILTLGVGNDGTINDGSLNGYGMEVVRTGIGIKYTGYPGADYTYPGDSFHYYSIGYNAPWGDLPHGNTSLHMDGGTDVPATTTYSSDSAFTEGTYGNGDDLNLAFQQHISLTGSTVNFAVTLTNTGTSALVNVAYGNGFDPNQDVNAFGVYDTINFETINTISEGRVTATGARSGSSISIVGNGTASISSLWDTDPYSHPNDGNGDYTIAMAWDLGTLAPGATKTINFDYALTAPTAPTPEPASMMLLGTGLAGLLGARKLKKKQAA